jgi:hypothetical protein
MRLERHVCATVVQKLNELNVYRRNLGCAITEITPILLARAN